MSTQDAVDELAQTIRRIDGDHAMGAAELADALTTAGYIKTGPVTDVDVEAGAKAAAGEYDRRSQFKPGTWWSQPHRRDMLRNEVRAALKAVKGMES